MRVNFSKATLSRVRAKMIYEIFKNNFKLVGEQLPQVSMDCTVRVASAQKSRGYTDFEQGLIVLPWVLYEYEEKRKEPMAH